MKTKHSLALRLATTVSLATMAPRSLVASDHADGPTVAGDQAADLADCYFFVDPTDSTKVVIINTLRGFIVPGEAGNFAVFDSSIRYRFQIENNENANPDAFIDVRFSEKTLGADKKPAPQTATVTFSGKAFKGLKGTYTGLTTNPGLAATPPNGANYFPATPQKLKDAANTDSVFEFFAGETDDPFFFDIPGFVRFRDSVLAGAKDVTQLARGRDTFAGYNVLTIAFRVPITALKSTKTTVTNATKFGLNVLSQRQTETTFKGRKIGSGEWNTVDREGLPGINALLVPLDLKNKYNAGTTLDDAAGKFAPAIVGTLTALGIHGTVTDPTTNLGLLAKLAVLNGDILRIDTSIATAFPNGRKPSDDVVKTYLTIISNANESASTLDDGVAANDVPFSANFPYLGLPQQPRDPNANPTLNADDNTRN